MNNLAEDCIVKFLSLTTPRDVCRSSAVSKIFRSAADSDHVWNHFLPSRFPVRHLTLRAQPEPEPVEASLFLDPDDVQPSMVTLMSAEQGRTDGCFEVELGRFFKRRGDLGELQMTLKETKRPFEKKGLLVFGIEIRPLP